VHILINGNAILVHRIRDDIWRDGCFDLTDTPSAPRCVVTDAVRSPRAIASGVAVSRVAFPDLAFRVDELGTNAEAVLLNWTPSASTICGDNRTAKSAA
jgi:hypothetical protein